MTDTDLKRTPLCNRHIELGAKMVPFAGWEMPVQYTGVIEEHRAVREKAGLFDVSHMGEIFVRGKDAEAAIDSMTCNAVAAMREGAAQYNAIINDQGGVVDDIIVYKFKDDLFLICVNASNADKDYEWFSKHNTTEAVFENLSSEYGQVALQGPEAAGILDRLAGANLSSSVMYFQFMESKIAGEDVIVARTGYTGEDGFEIFISTDRTAKLWDLCLDAGSQSGLVACGLGARDTLRLEACYPLHGHELRENVSAIESGLGWIVKPGKGAFIGRDILAEQKANGAPRTLVAFVVDDAGIVREGAFVSSKDGKELGIVTSGTRTPTLNKSVGMALVSSKEGRIGTEFLADVRGRKIACHVVEKPLYKSAHPSPK